MTAAENHVRELVTGYRRSRLTALAVESGIVEELAQSPLPPGVLAERCGLADAVAPRLLEGLADIGIVQRGESGYALTEAGRLLCRGMPGSLADWAVNSCGVQYDVWAQADYAARTGRPAFEAVFGRSFWEYLAGDSQAAAGFDAAMADSAAASCALVREEAGLVGSGVVVDVGGGSGALARLLLETYPEVRVLVADLPGVVERAAESLARFGNRVSVVSGSFLEEIPPGGDAYVLCRILADWGDEDAHQLLCRCREAMQPGTPLLVAGGLHDPRRPGARGLLDLHLLMMLGGQERTAEQTGTLLERAGFLVERITGTADGGSSLVVATAV